MKVRYIGRNLSVRVPDAGNVYVSRGEIIEVPDSLGKSLLNQMTNWEKVKESPKKAETVQDEEDDNE